MSSDHKSTNASQDPKATLRRISYDARKAEPDKDSASRRAIDRLVQLESYRSAECVLWYLDCRSELRTRWFMPTATTSGKNIVVPYCTSFEGQPALGLWRLESLDELSVGKWQILEPPRERWHEPDRMVTAGELDLVVVPGVGFTRGGSRLGNGQGYYDRLLAQVRRDCVLVGLAYECQLFDELPVEQHDVSMNWVVTESAAHRCEPPSK